MIINDQCINEVIHVSGQWKSNSSGPRSRGVKSHIQKRVLRRDRRQCQIMAIGCLGDATQVDHIIPVFEGGDDSQSNLQAVCTVCHNAKTQAEAKRARARKSRKRPPAGHVMDGVKTQKDWEAIAEAVGVRLDK